MQMSQFDLPQVKIPVSTWDLGIDVNAALESCRSKLGGCFNASTTLELRNAVFSLSSSAFWSSWFDNLTIRSLLKLLLCVEMYGIV